MDNRSPPAVPVDPNMSAILLAIGLQADLVTFLSEQLQVVDFLGLGLFLSELMKRSPHGVDAESEGFTRESFRLSYELAMRMASCFILFYDSFDALSSSVRQNNGDVAVVPTQLQLSQEFTELYRIGQGSLFLCSAIDDTQMRLIERPLPDGTTFQSLMDPIYTAFMHPVHYRGIRESIVLRFVADNLQHRLIQYMGVEGVRQVTAQDRLDLYYNLDERLLDSLPRIEETYT